VGWYNGHPDFVNEQFDLSRTRAVVVGLGNVAMDVARILIQKPAQLAATDIAEHALEALTSSQIREVVLLGRRGAAQAAFSPREIRDIDELEDVALSIDGPEQTLEMSIEDYSGDAQKNLEFLQNVARRPTTDAPRRVRLKFLCSPVELLPKEGRSGTVKVEHNRLVTRDGGRLSAEGTGQFEELPSDLIFRSIGYRGTALPNLPFDEGWGVICNDQGRVTECRGGPPIPRLFTAGWIKRGPIGLIGTNKTDAKETVEQMLAEAKSLTPSHSGSDAIARLLSERGVRTVSFADWRVLDELELANGQRRGKVREKFCTAEAMLDALAAARS